MKQEDAERASALFRKHDEDVLAQQYSIHENEAEVVQTMQNAAAQLKEVFEQDAALRAEAEKNKALAVGPHG